MPVMYNSQLVDPRASWNGTYHYFINSTQMITSLSRQFAPKLQFLDWGKFVNTHTISLLFAENHQNLTVDQMEGRQNYTIYFDF